MVFYESGGLKQCGLFRKVVGGLWMPVVYFSKQYIFLIRVALCSNPSAPVNGEVTLTGNSTGDIATYTCNPGFELVGDAGATCTQDAGGNNASFAPAAPTCHRTFQHIPHT